MKQARSRGLVACGRHVRCSVHAGAAPCESRDCLFSPVQHTRSPRHTVEAPPTLPRAAQDWDVLNRRRVLSNGAGWVSGYIAGRCPGSDPKKLLALQVRA